MHLNTIVHPCVRLTSTTSIDAVHDSQESELTYLRDFVGNQVCFYSIAFYVLNDFCVVLATCILCVSFFFVFQYAGAFPLPATAVV